MPERSPSSQSKWRMLVFYEIDGDDIDAAEDKKAALDKAAKKLGIESGFTDACGPQRETCPAPICGRLLVGLGSDTYDPLCILPEGHAGLCKHEEADW